MIERADAGIDEVSPQDTEQCPGSEGRIFREEASGHEPGGYGRESAENRRNPGGRLFDA